MNNPVYLLGDLLETLKVFKQGGDDISKTSYSTDYKIKLTFEIHWHLRL